VVEKGLVVDLALDVGRVVFGQPLVLLLQLLQEDLQVLGLHQQD